MSLAAVRAGVARLLPVPPAGPLPLAVPRRRVYILPSGFGLVYALALLVLMIGALNYNNNAAILLALLLGMAAMASAHGAVRLLSGLSLRRFESGEAFAGQGQPCRLLVHSVRGRLAGDLRLAVAGLQVQAGTDRDGQAVFEWTWPSDRRGRRPLGRVRLSTTWPLGLFRAWTVLEPEAAAVVYPAPETPPAPLPAQADLRGDRHAPRRGEQDWHALREFQRGDALRDIAWKVSARHDRWLVAETRSASQAPALAFSLDQVAHLDREAGLSRLCRWLLMAEAAQLPYALRLPGADLATGLGGEQRRRALTALAQLP
jgi:uncharacterized protein (DUF58 family)